MIVALLRGTRNRPKHHARAVRQHPTLGNTGSLRGRRTASETPRCLRPICGNRGFQTSFYPGGVTAISRGLRSEATTPPDKITQIHRPRQGSQRFRCHRTEYLQTPRIPRIPRMRRKESGRTLRRNDLRRTPGDRSHVQNLLSE